MWKQPNRTAIDEWIHKMCYIHIMRYYPAIKWNKILINAKTWMNLGSIFLREGSQPYKPTLHAYTYVKCLE